MRLFCGRSAFPPPRQHPTKSKEANSKLKDFEHIPFKEDVVSTELREVRPYVADDWIDRDTLDEQDGGIGKVGFEINVCREFIQYQPPRGRPPRSTPSWKAV